MNHSTQRILTTHAGSLPRPDDLLELLWTRERGEAVDEQTFTGRLRDAVTDCVRVQAEHGLDIIDDGEMGKASFLTYANERLSGFEPSSGSAPASRFAGRRNSRPFPSFIHGSRAGRTIPRPGPRTTCARNQVHTRAKPRSCATLTI
jgi:5-methyltetrahydropteroyltriglutamate--homocysteine methyltransferase